MKHNDTILQYFISDKPFTNSIIMQYPIKHAKLIIEGIAKQ